jgi:putative membrane protein
METVGGRVRRRARDRPLGVTLLLTVLGYGLVIGTFAGVVPLYPDIGERGVDLLSHAIAVVNTVATVSLALGWYWIRRDEVDKHRLAMVAAFALIVLFLLLYLPKVGGGGEKHFVLESAYAWVPLWSWIHPAYLVMLAIHILLSVLAVPLVLYALVLGLTHTPTELTRTSHARIGRWAAASWILSLVLGVVTYLMLNHLYAAEFVPA